MARRTRKSEIEEIVRLRTEEKLTRAEISDKLGISVDTVGKYAKGLPIDGKRNGLRLPDDIIAQIFSLREQGKKVKEIASQLGIHLWTVEKYLKSQGKLRRIVLRVHPQEVTDKIPELYASGLNKSEISRQLGVPYNTVRYHLNGRHVPQSVPDYLQEAIRLRTEEGLSGVEIAKRTGVPYNTLRVYLQNYRLEKSQKRINVQKQYADLEQQAIHMRTIERLSEPQIVKKLGIGKNTIREYLREIPLSKDEIKQKIVEGMIEAGSAFEDSEGNVVFNKRSDRGESSKAFSLVRGELTKRRKGQIAESAIRWKLSAHDLDGYFSDYDTAELDGIVVSSRTGKTSKIQIRYAKESRKGLPSASLVRSSDKVKYSKENCDFLIAYDLYQDKAYIYPIEELEQFSSFVSICPQSEERWELLHD